MKTTNVKNQIILAAKEDNATGFVISRDGTSIGYHQLGRGPGLVLVQGTMGTAHHFTQLAQMLADTFTVYVPDRRGRGISGPGGKDYNMGKEVDDLEAVLTATGSRYVFGLSSGAMISLQAALTLPGIQRLAIFEPPLFTRDSMPVALIARYEKEISEGKVAAALVTGMKAGKFGPSIFNAVPRRFLERLVEQMMKKEERQGSNGYPSMKELAPTLHYDFQLVNEMCGDVERFEAIRAEVLLLGGRKSPAYLRDALDRLEKALLNARRIEFPRLDHAAPWNTDRGGRPAPVAQELRRFFADS